ncbi:hypothetical protein LTR37_012492 [Vermiconidia calcicola]|uniref:Uncharacterized protein n=1 Tax=Vermiconidia calcicola TaxID=1690605 RepID=A0ACC3MZD2_9PEZI|nr:hypothetical protein LTR37_012492 [Vermiconidia calcicola]
MDVLTNTGIYKVDKSLRRYGVTIERALASWEISPQEWADYIAFLGRLLKAIQSHPDNAPLLPHSREVASKLAQCLNPALPSGVHQKALEVYTYIFSTFGQGYLSGHLPEFLPGLSAVLSFASLSVRPGLYSIFEEYIVHLPAPDLRPILKSLILSLLPALEETSSEDFDRAFRVLETLERVFSPTRIDHQVSSEKNGFYWQCLFLAVITSPSRRLGALNFLTQRLPKFTSMGKEVHRANAISPDGKSTALSPAAEALISPEPGLLIRCFACGLSDPQVLIQRGFLDLLVTHLPLDSPLLQQRVRTDDLDHLISSAVLVLLRREMSLNRRLWSWFLGPDPKASTRNNEGAPPSVNTKPSTDAKTDWQFQYFAAHGRAPLERCILAMFKRSTSHPTERARPFRICLSLMDRWEIGGSIVPHMFIPAIESAYDYSSNAPPSDIAEVVRSASLFFDGVEATLIWGNLIRVLSSGFSKDAGRRNLHLFSWTVQHFNIKDEEMLTTHVPYAAVYLLSLLLDSKASAVSPLDRSISMQILSTLLEIIPERAFTSLTDTSTDNAVSSAHTVQGNMFRADLDAFYRGREQSISTELPFGPPRVAEVLCRLAKSLAVEALNQRANGSLGATLSLLLTLQWKLPNTTAVEYADLLTTFRQHLDLVGSQESALMLPDINSMISFLVGLSSTPKREQVITKADVISLEPSLTAQLWRCLSPALPKYHVEAARAMWQLQDLVSPSDRFEVSLNALVRRAMRVPVPSKYDRAEAVRRFTVLWNLTVPAPSGGKTGLLCSTRRGSAMLSIADAKQASYRQTILLEPLMLVVDLLNDPADVAFGVVKAWLSSLPSLEQILRVHFELMGKHTGSDEKLDGSARNALGRLDAQRAREVEYILEHFLNILRHGNNWVWQCLSGMVPSSERDNDATTGFVTLAEYCASFLCDERHTSPKLERTSIELLDILLATSSALSLKALDLDSRLMDRLVQCLAAGQADTQGPMLKLITQALQLRLATEPRDVALDRRARASISLRRPASVTDSRSSPSSSSANISSPPPPQLLSCLKAGFTATAARSNMDEWLSFLSDVLPIFSDAIFASLIPLVECLCNEIDKAHADIAAVAKTGNSVSAVTPETMTVLLEALEMILARAHECLVDDQNAEPVPKAALQSRGLFGNVTAGVFRADGPPSRTHLANSRLTVVLALHDAIRVSLKLWIWASHYPEDEEFDKASAATTSHNALKIRSRTRHLLDHIFAVEPLESLEVLIYSWCYPTHSTLASAAVDLLHVLQGLRPKNMMPVILDALCSRTNPVALPLSRQSSQTIDLKALDVTLFLSAYLGSIEDDATDEVWSDSLAFLRDVLLNPLPYRQVLPALLSIALLLAEKVNNTNFGEQRRMRRDLGDVFQRLLAATFTTMPSGLSLDSGGLEIHSAVDVVLNSTNGRTTMRLANVLQHVTANIEILLETSDRTVNAINSISANLIAPMLRAKSFPDNITTDALALLLQISKKAPLAKPWKKELLDAFNDPKFLTCSVEQMEDDWFPILYQWCTHDKERMPELMSRLTPPSSAGIMFGVGANAARLDADRRTQLNLRRITLLLLASPADTFVTHYRLIEEKLVELFSANASSSPSIAVKSELFMLCRALVFSSSAVHSAPIWPIINDNLQAALLSLSSPNTSTSNAFGNLALLQACKLLDVLVVISPDEFQLHEWLYISDTIDAVYQPSHWTPVALSDQIAETLALEPVEDSPGMIQPTPVASGSSSHRRPLIDNDALADKEDLKAMALEDFARTVLRPFLSQLSLSAYEGVYSMHTPDIDICRRGLLQDTLDLSTIVE